MDGKAKTKNVDTAEWVPIDMKAVEAIATRVKVKKTPTIDRVERLDDIVHVFPDHVNQYVQLRLVMSDGRTSAMWFDTSSEGRAQSLAMLSPVVVGMTEREFDVFMFQLRWEYLGEYRKKCQEA